LVSALKGISTEVETFSRNTVRLRFPCECFPGEMRAGEDAAGEPFALANQSKQQVLGFNRNAAELASFIPGEEKHAPGSFRIPFEHRVPRYIPMP
jgi:hypothetical protein